MNTTPNPLTPNLARALIEAADRLFALALDDPAQPDLVAPAATEIVVDLLVRAGVARGLAVDLAEWADLSVESLRVALEAVPTDRLLNEVSRVTLVGLGLIPVGLVVEAGFGGPIDDGDLVAALNDREYIIDDLTTPPSLDDDEVDEEEPYEAPSPRPATERVLLVGFDRATRDELAAYLAENGQPVPDADRGDVYRAALAYRWGSID